MDNPPRGIVRIRTLKCRNFGIKWFKDSILVSFYSAWCQLRSDTKHFIIMLSGNGARLQNCGFPKLIDL